MKQCSADGKNEQRTIVEKQVQADAQYRPLWFGVSPVRRRGSISSARIRDSEVKAGIASAAETKKTAALDDR